MKAWIAIHSRTNAYQRCPLFRARVTAILDGPGAVPTVCAQTQAAA